MRYENEKKCCGPSVEFSLFHNYPNPFNPTTGIRCQVPGTSNVRLIVYDLLGREVAALVDENKRAGVYEVQFNAGGLASGVYLYRMTAANPPTGSGRSFVETKKLILLR